MNPLSMAQLWSYRSVFKLSTWHYAITLFQGAGKPPNLYILNIPLMVRQSKFSIHAFLWNHIGQKLMHYKLQCQRLKHDPVLHVRCRLWTLMAWQYKHYVMSCLRTRGCIHHSGVKMDCSKVAVPLVSLLHGELRPPLAQLIHVECGVWQVSYLQIPHLQKISWHLIPIPPYLHTTFLQSFPILLLKVTLQIFCVWDLWRHFYCVLSI